MIENIRNKEMTLRIARPDYDRLAGHLQQGTTEEQFAFLLCGRARSADEVVLIVHSMFLPDRCDLSTQGPGGVAPTRGFQSFVYTQADRLGLSIVDVHTHPHQTVPRLSPKDMQEWPRSTRTIDDLFAARITTAMIVFDPSVTAFDGVVYDRESRQSRPVERLEILGRNTKIRLRRRRDEASNCGDSRYARQFLLPGWDQTTISRQRIVIVGVGGSGAQVLQPLVCIGAGIEGWIAVIDPDIVEESNLPRIPYAHPEHVGTPKVTVAAQYAGRKNACLPVYPYPCSVKEHAAEDRIKAATLLVGAGDNDGVRHNCNELAVRYSIPYIDLGCDILAENDGFSAGGQVRVVLPGENACLVCCGGYDPTAAASELADDSQVADRAAAGYVRGHTGNPTPSISNLNGTTAQLAMAAFLSIVHGDRFGAWDYAYFDQLTAQTITARTSRRDSCPLCGLRGSLGAGDAPPANRMPSSRRWVRMGPGESFRHIDATVLEQRASCALRPTNTVSEIRSSTENPKATEQGED